jgi:hypothetical protein
MNRETRQTGTFIALIARSEMGREVGGSGMSEDVHEPGNPGAADGAG